MKPSTRIRHLCVEDPDTAQYIKAVAAILNAARQHVSAARLQMAETALEEAARRLRACLPVTREEYERLVEE